METLKYNYGETPEEVIRKQSAARSYEGGPFKATWKSGPTITTNNLITVLDALTDSTMTEERDGIRGDADQKAVLLRIDILAALGIEES